MNINGIGLTSPDVNVNGINTPGGTGIRAKVQIFPKLLRKRTETNIFPPKRTSP